MKFLDGFKTILGLLMAAGAVVVKGLGHDEGIVTGLGSAVGDLADQAGAIVAGAGAVLATLGIIHKKEKAKASRESQERAAQLRR